MVALLWAVCHAQLASAQPTPSVPKGRAAELTLRGTFGEDFDELTIERFLTAAKGAGTDTVIFRLDSGGGFVATASAMLAVLDNHRNQFTYVCRIKSAISASLWIVCGCDEVLIEPNGEVGGAVIYTTTSSGSVDVDAKQNSIKATRLATNGASNSGIPELLVRAMIEMPVQVWWHKGSRTLRDNAPVDRDGWEEIDSPTRVLTLSVRPNPNPDPD